MQKKHLCRAHLTQMLFVGVMIGLMMFISACGDDGHAQQQASQNKAQLDHLLQQARDIGVPLSVLQPVLQQEQQLSNSNGIGLNTQSNTDYYQYQATHYNQLTAQVRNIITSNTQQFQSQAQTDMQNFQLALSQVGSWGHYANILTFSERFSHDQLLLSAAHYPKDYAVISANARLSTQALDQIEPTFQQLTTFKNTITQLQAASLDVTAMQVQYRADMQAYNSTFTQPDFLNLGSLIDAQYQEAVVSSIQALPYVGAAKLRELQTQINALQGYGIDTSKFQKHLVADQAAIKQASSVGDYLKVATQINADLATIQISLLQAEATQTINRLDRSAKSWGQAHLFHDSFDNNHYILTAGYTLDGMGSLLNEELGAASSLADYQAVVDEEKNDLYNLQLLEADYYDTTPYNQVHATDLQLLDHYNLTHSQVLMVSLVEQALRIYQDGNLVAAFHVTTGRVELPSLPGIWSVVNRQAPTIFKSNDPPDSPYWYPPTPINYAIEYHDGGYFVHDGWWRQNFGPGTQFPHYDTGGDETYAGNGSHGCINMQEDQAAWVYNHTDWNTVIAVY
ncbi:MAG TPA: L,D-transpeptidase [Ktedonobacteraceae bacterium]|nr:L,D-transpeptidase [Ktedonobacteraceae bacterium]